MKPAAIHAMLRPLETTWVMGIFKWAGVFDSSFRVSTMSLAGIIFLGPCRALPAFAALWTMPGAKGTHPPRPGDCLRGNRFHRCAQPD